MDTCYNMAMLVGKPMISSHYIWNKPSIKMNGSSLLRTGEGFEVN